MKTTLLSVTTCAVLAFGAFATTGQSAAAEMRSIVADGPGHGQRHALRCRPVRGGYGLAPHAIRRGLRAQGFYAIGRIRLVNLTSYRNRTRCGYSARRYYQVQATRLGQRYILMVNANTGRPFNYRRIHF